MSAPEPDPAPHRRLDEISTLWTLVRQAHGDVADEAIAAQALLLERYTGAARRYLLGALRDPEAADDVFQEFALALLRGDFKNANPGRGRFRNFLKTALYHRILDYHRRRAREVVLDPAAHEPVVEPPSMADSDRDLLESWRAELMDRTWRALAELEAKTGQPHHTVLRIRTDQPGLSSDGLAAEMSVRVGRAFTPQAVRQALHRAREKFTDLLLDEVIQSLEGPSRQELEDELTNLGILPSCRAALDRRYPDGKC